MAAGSPRGARHGGRAPAAAAGLPSGGPTWRRWRAPPGGPDMAAGAPRPGSPAGARHGGGRWRRRGVAPVVVVFLDDFGSFLVLGPGVAASPGGRRARRRRERRHGQEAVKGISSRSVSSSHSPPHLRSPPCALCHQSLDKCLSFSTQRELACFFSCDKRCLVLRLVKNL